MTPEERAESLSAAERRINGIDSVLEMLDERTPHQFAHDIALREQLGPVRRFWQDVVDKVNAGEDPT